MKLKITLLFIVLINTCFGQVDFEEYTNEMYSVNYPKQWRLDTSGTMSTEFILFSELKEDDAFSENVNMIVQDLSNQGFTMKSYMKLSENQIKNMVPDSKIIESVFDKENKHHMLVWSGNVTGQVLKFKQYFYLEKEKIYVLSLTTLPETYDSYITIGEKILDSFKLK